MAPTNTNKKNPTYQIPSDSPKIVSPCFTKKEIKLEKKNRKSPIDVSIFSPKKLHRLNPSGSSHPTNPPAPRRRPVVFHTPLPTSFVVRRASVGLLFAQARLAVGDLRPLGIGRLDQLRKHQGTFTENYGFYYHAKSGGVL